MNKILKFGLSQFAGESGMGPALGHPLYGPGRGAPRPQAPCLCEDLPNFLPKRLTDGRE